MRSGLYCSRSLPSRGQHRFHRFKGGEDVANSSGFPCSYLKRRDWARRCLMEWRLCPSTRTNLKKPGARILPVQSRTVPTDGRERRHTCFSGGGGLARSAQSGTRCRPCVGLPAHGQIYVPGECVGREYGRSACAYRRRLPRKNAANRGPSTSEPCGR